MREMSGREKSDSGRAADRRLRTLRQIGVVERVEQVHAAFSGPHQATCRTRRQALHCARIAPELRQHCAELRQNCQHCARITRIAPFAGIARRVTCTGVRVRRRPSVIACRVAWSNTFWRSSSDRAAVTFSSVRIRSGPQRRPAAARARVRRRRRQEVRRERTVGARRAAGARRPSSSPAGPRRRSRPRPPLRLHRRRRGRHADRAAGARTDPPSSCVSRGGVQTLRLEGDCTEPGEMSSIASRLSPIVSSRSRLWAHISRRT